ncbi:CoA transferase [SAR202 cluster bacterium AD-802-E10_MRT_200m]|nr:CoA transferase [SAR202 cluster bacterium AD-802-E10_MRT_200m]
MSTILKGLNVLDLTEGMAGSLASMILADNGAAVIKIERPTGDPYRSNPAWIMWNRGKKSLTLDLNDPAAITTIKKLVPRTDVFIENFRPGITDSLGLGYNNLATINHALIYGSLTCFGSTGPYARYKPYNAIAEAKSGGYLRRGQTNAQPIYRVRPRGDYSSALMLVQGIAAALRVQHMTGLGQKVESSAFAGVVFTDSSGATARQLELGIMDPQPGDRGRLAGASINLSYLNVRCKDGQWLQMANFTDRLFSNLIRVINLSWIFGDSKFQSAPRIANREDALELRRLIYEQMQKKPIDEWIKIFRQEDVCGDRYLTTQQAMDHPYVASLNGVVDIDDPHVGHTKQIGPLIQFANTPSEIGLPSPLLGQHNIEILNSLPRSISVGKPTKQNNSKTRIPDHPLSGMLVLDFATFNAGPQGASLIADLGARVIKVEGPNSEDAPGGHLGRGRTFQGKESLVVDLKTSEGRHIIEKLLAKADGLIHNMRGNTPSRLGLDFETVKTINPEIVYLYAASYGSKGLGVGRAAFHPIAGCLSGGPLWQLGKNNSLPVCDTPMTIEEIEKCSETLMAANESLPDQISAIGVGTALALALLHKSKTGQGQYLETSMLISNLYLCSDDFIRYEGKPERREPDQSLQGIHALHRLYEAKDSWLLLTCPLEEEWEGLCHAINLPELITDYRFSTHQARLRNDAWLTAILWPIFKEYPAEDWEEYLLKFDVASSRADTQRTEDFLLTDAGVKEADLVVDVSHPTTGKMKRVSPAIRLSLTPGRAGAPHTFGEDTPYILTELNTPNPEIKSLRERGIIKWT